jgi:putative nucleotidyltransferase with HDIG domain
MSEQDKRINALSQLCQVGRDLSSSRDLDELLVKIAYWVVELSGSETSSILLLDEDREELYFREIVGQIGEIYKKIRIPLNQSYIAGACFLNGEAMIINDVTQEPRFYKKVDEATKFVTRSILAVPIIYEQETLGVIESVNKKGEAVFDEADREYLTILASQAAVALRNVLSMEQLQNFYMNTTELFIIALENMEPGTEGHIIRVARVATRLARMMKLSDKEFETIWKAAYFHDIGKLKLGSCLTPRKDRRHPVLGAEILSSIKLLQKAAPLVRYHHERFDGSGFPEGLVGDQIPLGARILGLAEDYDEQWMTWKETSGTPEAEFRRSFIENSRRIHDPALLDLFETADRDYGYHIL